MQETPGFEVVLFADRHSATSTFDLCPVHYAIKFSLNNVVAFFQRIGWFVFSTLRFPVKVYRLMTFNRRLGFSLSANVASVLRSYHIFNEKVDWLHFGFGTMALGREHVARVMGAKMAVSFRGFDIAIYPLKHKGCYTLLWENVDQVHVISEDLLRLVHLQGYPVDRPIKKITPAIDIDKFSNVQSTNENHILQLLTVARLHWKKGLEYTLEALAQLMNRGVNFHYTIIGEGEERERLVFAAHQLGLQDRVTFAGRLPHDEVKKELSKTDLYIQYSIQEGFCNAVLEAQAMGLLCVVSDAEGLSENVLHEQTGWVVPKRKPNLLAAKINEVIRLDEHTRKAIRSRAMLRVRDDFNLERQRAEFCSFYLQNELM